MKKKKLAKTKRKQRPVPGKKAANKKPVKNIKKSNKKSSKKKIKEKAKKVQKKGGTRKPVASKKPRADSGKIKTSTISGTKKKSGPALPLKPTPQENLTRPFNIIESYMGTYSFDDIFGVLLVCTGNMCRSPLAEGILKKKIAEECPENLRDKFFIQSCGIYAYEGNKPSESAVKIGLQNMIDISAIRSKPVNRVLIEQSDLILALSIDHLNFITESFPSARGKTHLLKLYGQSRPIRMSDSIPDPMGFSMEFYAKTYAEIKNSIDDIFPTIVKAAEAKLGHITS